MTRGCKDAWYVCTGYVIPISLNISLPYGGGGGGGAVMIMMMMNTCMVVVELVVIVGVGVTEWT